MDRSIFLGILFVSQLAYSGAPLAEPKSIRLDRQPLTASLNVLSTNFGVQVFYRQAHIHQIMAEAVNGEYELDEMFAAILRGTGLVHRKVSKGTYIIEPALVASSSVTEQVAEKSIEAHAPADDPISTADEAPPGIEVVLVTARKRDEVTQDIPLAVSSLNEQEIKHTFSRDIRELRATAPNVIIDSGNANTSSMSIRGISLSDLEKSFDPAVGIMVDGVYLGSTSAALLSTFDVEQVEILRGPQGTIQGKNTTGGLLKLVHSRPTGEWGGMLATSIGSHNLTDYKALLNMPLVADKLAAKVKLSAKRGGGFIRNTVADRTEGGADFSSYGVSLLANPWSQLEIQYSYTLDDDDSDSIPFVNSSPDDSVQCEQFQECGRQFAGRRTNESPEDHPASFDVSLHILRVDYDLSHHRLTAISGYRYLDEEIVVDYDSAASRFLLTDRPAVDRTFSQEVQLSSNWSSTYQYVFGLFYWDREYSLDQTTRHLFELPFYVAGGTQFFTMDQETDAWSAYAQTDIQLTDDYILTLGGRYISERKTARGTLTFFDENGISLFDTGNPQRVAGGGPARLYADTARWTRFTPNIALRYLPSDHMMLYASVTEGFRSGGHNGRARSQSALQPYDPESVTNFEVGLKSDWLNRSLLFNQTLFMTKYKDKQEIFSTFVGDISTALVANAASATQWGLELELQYMLGGMKISSSYGYLNAQYDRYEVSGPDSIVVDFTDESLLLAPKYTFGLSFNYTQESFLYDGLSASYILQVNYRDSYQTSGDHPDHGIVDGHTLVNAALDFSSEHWRLSLYGKNLGNVYYRPYTNNVIDGITGKSLFSLSTVNAPRTWGVELAYTF